MFCSIIFKVCYLQVINLKGGLDVLDKPPSFEELLEHAGVVFCNDPVVIIKSEHQQNLPISSWEELIEKLIS